MIQFKEKSQKQKEIVSVGLFNYPALMAADILLYQSDEVPVGEDQKQHVEFTRDVAGRFNRIYGEVFKLPEACIDAPTARIMSLQDPASKMSKSDPSPDNRLGLLDPPEVLAKKVKRAVTDSGDEVRAAQDKPALTNLLAIYSALTNQGVGEIEKNYVGIHSYKKFKEDLAEVVVEFLGPIQARHREFLEDPKHLTQILESGLAKARPLSEVTLKQVHTAVGLG